MILTKKIIEIKEYLEENTEIEYRIINNTLGKNLILISGKNTEAISKRLLKGYGKYIQEIIIEEKEEDAFIIKEIKKICPTNNIVHRNVSYVNWNREVDEKFYNIIAGYSFKGGMGRSTTLAYLAYLQVLLEKKVVVLDCDFEAPGIASMFFDKEQREKKSGILDYFVDLNITEKLNLDDYSLKEDSLYLFPSGIDYNIENYMNKISKTDFNSTEYTDKFTTLITQINTDIKPDLIFIDLRAGINESNGLILKHLSNTNLMFFNSEEQNEDGLQVVLSLFDNLDNNFIMNSTIRYQLSAERERNEKKLKDFLGDKFVKLERKNIISIPYESVMLESTIKEFKSFIQNQKKLYDVNTDVYLQEVIEVIDTKYFNKRDILLKLEKVFLKLGEIKATKRNLAEIIINKIKESLTNEELFKIKILNEENNEESIKLLFNRDINWIIDKFKDNKVPLKNIYKFILINIRNEKLEENSYNNLFSLIASQNHHRWKEVFEETMGMRNYGKQNQISFNSDSQYYKALGYLAKSDGTTSLTWENNKEQGAWGSEGRIHFYVDNPKISGYFKHTKGTGNIVSRVNCNEFILNLYQNHNFINANNQNIENIRSTVPSQYIDDFNYGLTL